MNKYDYNNLTPFKWFVLENFPFIEADFDALTNWQLFCKLGKEMNKLIDTMNNVGQGMEDFSQELINSFNEFTTEINTTVEDYITRFNQLKDFVDNYFDNLDVQEEINNKLDDMVEAGTLQEIITSYLNSKALFCFDNVQGMKEATNLIDGSFARTLGFHNSKDGGNGLYKIRNKTNEDIINEMNLISLNNQNLVAELIILDCIFPEMLGAFGDGVENDRNFIQFALDNYNIIKFYKKTYRADNLNIPEQKYVDGNGCTIKALDKTNPIIILNRDIVIKNINVQGISADELSASGFLFSNQGYRIKLDNIMASWCEYGVTDLNGIWSIVISKLWIKNCENGFYISKSVSTSVSLDNYVHENCGNPLYFKNVNYSNIGSLYGDYANGGEEENWAYGKGFGVRSNYVFHFVGCKGLTINSIGGENNVGKRFLHIEYSNITINNMYVIRQTSYDDSVNRALIGVSSEFSTININNFIYYEENSQNPNTHFDYYFDFPYNFIYGQRNYSLLNIFNGAYTKRTPNRIINRRSNTILSTGIVNTICLIENKGAKETLVIECSKNSNYYLPILLKINAVFSSNNEVSTIKGDISGMILTNSTIQCISDLKEFSNPNNENAITPTIETGKIKIPVPASKNKACVKIESIGNELEFNAYFE